VNLWGGGVAGVGTPQDQAKSVGGEVEDGVNINLKHIGGFEGIIETAVAQLSGEISGSFAGKQNRRNFATCSL
jgi:hypothetical protein